MRKLKKEEYDLIVFMLKDLPLLTQVTNDLSDKLVEEMDDGAMGSLLFVANESNKVRKFYKEIATVSFLDIDGVPVSFAINIDDDGDIFELDVFKGDFSPIKRFPVAPYHLLSPPDVL